MCRYVCVCVCARVLVTWIQQQDVLLGLTKLWLIHRRDIILLIYIHEWICNIQPEKYIKGTQKAADFSHSGFEWITIFWMDGSRLLAAIFLLVLILSLFVCFETCFDLFLPVYNLLVCMLTKWCYADSPSSTHLKIPTDCGLCNLISILQPHYATLNNEYDINFDVCRL